MKKIILFLFLFIICSGCYRVYYQVFKTKTTNTIIKDGFYVYENDTVKIIYTFWTSKGVMSFSVFNKSSIPLYIDWKNSSFIYNGVKNNYWIDETQTDLVSYYKGEYYNGPLLSPGYSVSAGLQVSSQKAVKPERITFIPPQSGFAKSSFLLFPFCYFNFYGALTTTVQRNDNPLETTKLTVQTFSSDDSPVNFRNYLAFSFSDTGSQFFFIDNEFYLSSVKYMEGRHFFGNKIDGRYQSPFKNGMSFYIQVDTYKCTKGWPQY